MTQQKKHERDPVIDISTPPLITLVKLRHYFRQKYKFNEPQVEIMVVSSSKSLKQGLANLAEIVAGEESVEKLEAVYHGFKGLFLNMGEPEWAAYTKEIEEKLLAGEQLDHRMIVGTMSYGVAEVLTYCGATDPARTKR